MSALDTANKRRKIRLGETVVESIGSHGGGLSLRCRRGKKGLTWGGRLNLNGRVFQTSLGSVDLVEYDEAVAKLQTWAKDVRDKEAQPAMAVTLRDALKFYRKDLVARGSYERHALELMKLIPDTLQDKPVELITAKEIVQWRDDYIASGKKAVSGNRRVKLLKAALNYAVKMEPGIKNRSWQDVGSIGGAETTNHVLLTDEEILNYVKKAYDLSHDLGVYLELLAVTGVRPMQARRLEVRDLLDGDRVNMPSSKKGRNRDVTRKPLPVPAHLWKALKVLAAGKKGKDVIFDRPEHEYGYLLNEKMMDPGHSLYALRHTRITKMLLAGIPVRVVAYACDTSVYWIEKTYSASIAGQAEDILRDNLADYSAPSADVVPLKRG